MSSNQSNVARRSPISQPQEYMFVEIIGKDPEAISDIQGIAERSSTTEILDAGFKNPDTSTQETLEESLSWEAYVEDVNLTHNADGTWTARDNSWELTTQGDSAMEAIRNLGKVIAAVQGEAGHTPSDRELESLGVEPTIARDDSTEDIPDFF